MNIFTKFTLTFIVIGGTTISAIADSEVWSFLPIDRDDWKVPIFPYVAAIPAGQAIDPKNLRAEITSKDLSSLRAQANGDRVIKRQIFKTLGSQQDVQNEKKALLPDDQSLQVATFQTAAGYFDKFGLLGIIQLLTTWQCNADEQCPQKIMASLDTLLAVGGVFARNEVFKDINGQPWIVATVTYEVNVGNERRVVPLKSRKLQVLATQ